MERIEILKRQLNRIEKRSEEAKEAMLQFNNMTFKEKFGALGSERYTRFIETQKWVFIKAIKERAPEHKNNIEALFIDFINKFLDEKVKNITEYLQLIKENGRTTDA